MIVWFSGTGNSRFVAERLAADLGDRMLRLSPGLEQICPDDRRVIWVCPVYSWGLPPHVRSAMRRVEVGSSGVVHHLVLTCGDDVGLTPQMWRKDMQKRSMTAGLAFSVTMPNNYVCLPGFDVDSREVADAKLAQAPQRIGEISRLIAAWRVGMEAKDDVVRGRFAWMKTRVIYPWFVRYAMSPKPFRYTGACISCGKCAAVCPLCNVDMRHNDGRKYPEWGSYCALCLACYHVCPRHAVEYGSATESKGQYQRFVH